MPKKKNYKFKHGSVEHQSIEAAKKILNTISKEERQAIRNKIKAMNLGGISVGEYLLNLKTYNEI